MSCTKGTIRTQRVLADALADALAPDVYIAAEHCKTLPFAIRDVPPGLGFTHLPLTTNIRGLPDGKHTGGCWVSPDGTEIWKGLDGGNPNYPAGGHCPTREAECLEMMASQPGFPRNWRIDETGNIALDGVICSRRWLVRPVCTRLPGDCRTVDINEALEIERGMRALRAKGWGINDFLDVGRDPDGKMCILDLSCASNNYHHTYDDEEDRLLEWFRSVDHRWLADLRSMGMKQVGLNAAMDNPWWPHDNAGHLDTRYRHVYASMLRPVTPSSADGLRDTFCVLADDCREVHTWVISREPLDDEMLKRWDIVWAWSPWDEIA